MRNKQCRKRLTNCVCEGQRVLCSYLMQRYKTTNVSSTGIANIEEKSQNEEFKEQ